ncbi:acid-sensing ion channel 1-like [Saccoglossus kowalevskii]|uniref:Acid-sensing ion channel 5-like n=1 Tax=Saccoglossus kowalevskii TaxID=10224 RepID=A0ABM0MBL8_SACKO|nr:PREDICTED: acid-sensing ion channel 5-like [Saccoglossus kowalevskii]
MAKKKRKGGIKVSDLLNDFAQRTTTHGVARIAASNTCFRRTAWIVVVLGAFTGYSLHAGSLIARFLRYEVAIKMEVVSEDSIYFPAVTVCNSNKLRLSAILNSTYKDLAQVNEPHFSFTYRGK